MVLVALRPVARQLVALLRAATVFAQALPVVGPKVWAACLAFRVLPGVKAGRAEDQAKMPAVRPGVLGPVWRPVWVRAWLASAATRSGRLQGFGRAAPAHARAAQEALCCGAELRARVTIGSRAPRTWP